MSATVLLINPPIYDFAAYDLFNKPLGLLTLAAVLRRNGYAVRLIDCLDRRHPALADVDWPEHLRNDGAGKYICERVPKPACLAHVPRYYRRYGLSRAHLMGELKRAAEGTSVAAVLMTSAMTYWYPGVADSIALVRQVLPEVPVGLGGIYAGLMPDHARRVCRPDRVFVGSDYAELSAWLASLGLSTLGDVPTTLTKSPAPAYDLYGQLDYVTLMTSLGCPFRCDYCASGRLQPDFQQLSSEVFVEQLQTVAERVTAHGGHANVALMDDALLAGAENHFLDIAQRVRRLRFPLQFHCPNGLHVRFITSAVAEALYAGGFRMIRLSYEAYSPDSLAQRHSDHKVTDTHFHRAVKNLVRAGYRRSDLDAYILTGLPGQTLEEIRRSAQAVHDAGLQVRICQYSPIPATPLFAEACRQYGIDPDEPLLHNNSIVPVFQADGRSNDFNAFKDWVTALNNQLHPPTPTGKV